MTLLPSLIQRAASFAIAVTACACASVEWQPTPPQLQGEWRGLSLHAAPGLLVAACDADEAASGHTLAAEAVEIWIRAGGTDPGIGLVIAIDAGSAVPSADAVEWVAQVRQWHLDAVGAPAESGGMQAQVQVPENVPVDLRRIASLTAGALSREHDPLGLPAAWIDAARWIVLAPTPALIETAVDEIVDAALAEELSFFERIVAAPFVPMVKGQVCAQLESEVRIRILEACCAASGAPASQLERCFEEAGLPPSSSVFHAAFGAR